MEAKEAIICIVNPGYTELVMNAAKDQGASGGTVIHAKGTGRRGIERILDIPVQQEKEIVLIVVSRRIRDNVLRNINTCVGLDTAGHGIAFSLPISEAIGFHSTH